MERLVNSIFCVRDKRSLSWCNSGYFDDCPGYSRFLGPRVWAQKHQDKRPWLVPLQRVRQQNDLIVCCRGGLDVKVERIMSTNGKLVAHLTRHSFE